MFVSLEVCQTSRSALAYQLERTYFGIRHSFLRSLVAQHPCWTEACFLPCTRLPDIVYQSLANYLLCTKAIRCDGAAELETSDGFQVWCRKHQVVFHPVSPYQHTMQGHIENLVPCTREGHIISVPGLLATFFEGILLRRALPLSASSGAFSFILSILW